MFIEGLEAVKTIAGRAETAVFAINLQDVTEVGLKPFFILEPDEKGKITVEAVRELISACTLKQPKSAYIFINHAEKLRNEAANALLKLLEEPNDNYHFLLFTPDPSELLPTILSRAEIYYLTEKGKLSTPVEATETQKELAHRILQLKTADLVDLAEDLTKKRKFTRVEVLELLSVTIEVAYKSYFATRKVAFLQKIPKLIKCYENIERNGHLKLHLIADLL